MLLKRIVDLIIGWLLLICLSPLMLFIAISIRITMGVPVFFTQYRVGFKEQTFKLFKFRTMTNECDNEGHLLADSRRITKLGRIIRSLSLDELPQLWNVIKGDLSIVGPRPLLIKYLERYPDKYKRRHDVKPGITGLAQINGRNNIPFSKRFEMDIHYIENISLLFDFQIILQTIIISLKREGTDISKDILSIDDVNITDVSRKYKKSV